MKKAAFTILLSLLGLAVTAQESQTTYNFLRLPVSAHAAALGGSNVSLVENDEALIFHNPALLATVDDRTINLNYMNYMSGANMLSAAFNRVIIERASVAVTAQYIDYGTMKQTTAENVQVGDFSAKDIALSGVFSYLLSDRWAGGITAKFITSYLGGYHSLAMGVDLGLNYFDPDREWSVSLVAANLGGQLKAYNEIYEKMPIDVQLGVSKRMIHTPFRLHGTLVGLNRLKGKFVHHLVAGVDILLSDRIWVGGGYNFRRAHEMTITAGEEESNHAAGLSLGAGLNLDRIKLNLAYGKYHVSSSSVVVNAAFAF